MFYEGLSEPPMCWEILTGGADLDEETWSRQSKAPDLILSAMSTLWLLDSKSAVEQVCVY